MTAGLTDFAPEKLDNLVTGAAARFLKGLVCQVQELRQKQEINAGIINSAQVIAGSYSFGRGWEVDVISAVVIGGTSMLGGIGKVWGTLIGIVFLGVIVNGMTILNLGNIYQNLIKATILLVALVVDSRLNPRDEQVGQQGDI